MGSGYTRAKRTPIGGMGQMKFDKRLHALQLIYRYLDTQHVNRAEVTSSDIVKFFNLPWECSYTLSATMRYVYGKKKSVNGIRVTEMRTFKKEGSPIKYTIETELKVENDGVA
jgi:hypothetical protein